VASGQGGVEGFSRGDGGGKRMQWRTHSKARAAAAMEEEPEALHAKHHPLGNKARSRLVSVPVCAWPNAQVPQVSDAHGQTRRYHKSVMCMAKRAGTTSQ